MNYRRPPIGRASRSCSVFAVGLVLAGMLTAFGCVNAPSAPHDPRQAIDAIDDPERPGSTRIAAMRGLDAAVERGEIPVAEAREALKQVAWRASESPLIRRVAYEELLDDVDHLDDTRRMTELMLRTEVVRARHDAIATRMANAAVDHDWAQLVPALVRSLATPLPRVSVEARPEYAAIQALAPQQPAPAVVWEVFTGERRGSDDDELNDRERLAAWTLLMRLDGGRDYAFARAHAARDAGADDQMLAAIVRGTRELHVTPITGPEVKWLMRLNNRRAHSAWSAMREAVDAFGAAPGDTLKLRHLAGLTYVHRHLPSMIDAPRSTLLAELGSRLGPRDVQWRARDTPGVIPNESLDANAEDMTRADLLLLLAAVEAIDRVGPGARRALGEIGDRDMLDDTTEHGGVLDADDDGALTIAHYPPRPMARVSDRRMIAPEALIINSDDALFHFHLHAQRYENGRLAGPSGADIDYARLHGRACVVFTFIDQATMNADYYQPNGAVIDLGMIDVRPMGDATARRRGAGVDG